MATTFLKLDVKPLEQLADALGRIDGNDLANANVDALNVVVDKTYDLARERMIRDINLTDQYVQSKMRVDRASRGDPRASITAFGGAANNTPLGRYDAQPVLVPRKDARRSSQQGPNRIGLPAGMKQAGVTVAVKRGSDNSGFVPRGFLLPLRRGNRAGGNGLGVFARDRQGKLKHFYGPSPYQLFAYQVDRIEGDVTELLEDELTNYVTNAIQKALG
jgi:hypothetical protein